jgi:hypothetical protein
MEFTNLIAPLRDYAKEAEKKWAVVNLKKLIEMSNSL